MNLRQTSFVLLLAAFLASPCLAQGRTVARLFWQDDSAVSIRCADLKKSSAGWSIDEHSVEGFPKLDPDEHSLAQMQTQKGLVIAVVRDAQDGTVGSGWLAIESGVVEEPHGDHSHWRFNELPRVSTSWIDTDQGNPAHVYNYGDAFVIANDKKNGFTLTSADRIRDAKDSGDAAKFIEGGNGHITLAVVPEKVAYATWIAPAGDDKGRVDVIGLGKNQGSSYSITCPSGMLHGAAINSGKAFFAPADGVCWVDVDHELDDSPESVVVHHASLGKDGDDKPLRTGAFATAGRHLVFTAGKGSDTKLFWMDASAENPEPKAFQLEVAEDEAISTPTVMQTRYGDTLAVMFGQFKESPENDRMIVVNLDPDRDGNFRDAKLRQTIKVGRNQMVGHSGYHAVKMLPDGRHAVLSNPGDGTLWVLSLSRMEVVAELKVDGAPTRLLAIGG